MNLHIKFDTCSEASESEDHLEGKSRNEKEKNPFTK
jgi:hypothetical protein